MRDFDLVVPSALLDAPLAAELLRGHALPHLERVAGRARSVGSFSLSAETALTTWQAWVFGARGGEAGASVNLAELWAAACGVAPLTAGGRFVAEPAHFAIGNAHLRLDEPEALDVTCDEARSLAETALPILADAGWRLAPIEATTTTHWMLSREDGSRLSGVAIERAIGDNVAAWQPRTPGAADDDEGALAWRRCLNEIQMAWFDHPMNAAREAAGRRTINALWLSGNGLPAVDPPRYEAIESGLALVAALRPTAGAGRALETFDDLIAPTRREDWGSWRDGLAGLDARIGILVRQLAERTIGSLTVVLCGRDAAKSLTVGARDLARFWRAWGRKPSLVELLTEPAA